MKIKDIFQMPVGTVINLDEKNIDLSIGDCLNVDDALYKVIGFAMHNKSSIFIDKTSDLKIGQSVVIVKQ